MSRSDTETGSDDREKLKVLSRLLAAQSMFEALADGAQIATFLCRAITYVPGASDIPCRYGGK